MEVASRKQDSQKDHLAAGLRDDGEAGTDGPGQGGEGQTGRLGNRMVQDIGPASVRNVQACSPG